MYRQQEATDVVWPGVPVVDSLGLLADHVDGKLGREGDQATAEADRGHEDSGDDELFLEGRLGSPSSR